MTNLELTLAALVIWLWSVGGVLAAGFVIHAYDLEQPKLSKAFLIFLLITWPLMALVAILSADGKHKHRGK
jgi:uncharacterized membrane protein YecN with MAPEG domain